MKTWFLAVAALVGAFVLTCRAQTQVAPVRVAIFGLTHDHANGVFPRFRDRKDVELVGVVESNPELIARYAARFHLDRSLFHKTLEEQLATTNVDAVATFTSTFEHRRVIELCAASGIRTVMMEKPLAVNLEHARAMRSTAMKQGMQIIVNYETTWYPANQEAYVVVNERHEIGDIRKVVVHDGHRGPKEIGCSVEFLDWLTDPVQNGGGALADFGCYGADLITWFMGGERPLSVTAVTQQIKPDVYPKVDDEATVLLTYPKAQGIIQASWNWPFDRKDMEIYGRTGTAMVPQRNVLRVRTGEGQPEKEIASPPLAGAEADPISCLVSVARGETKPSGLSSLELNMVVTEILDAARESARTGKRIDMASFKSE